MGLDSILVTPSLVLGDFQGAADEVPPQHLEGADAVNTGCVSASAASDLAFRVVEGLRWVLWNGVGRSIGGGGGGVGTGRVASRFIDCLEQVTEGLIY